VTVEHQIQAEQHPQWVSPGLWMNLSPAMADKDLIDKISIVYAPQLKMSEPIRLLPYPISGDLQSWGEMGRYTIFPRHAITEMASAFFIPCAFGVFFPF
jgi:hypothetical protein